MRKFISAAVAGLAIAGGAVALTSQAQAQPYPYYYGPPAGYYQAPPPNPYYYSQPYGYTRPYGQPYQQPYGSNSGLAAGLSVLGSVLGLDVGASGYSNVPVDRYGPDPNGMIAPDGHRIKCKLRRSYDSYYRRTITRRECW